MTEKEAAKIRISPDEADNPLNRLTKRELEVVDLIVFGYSNRDIAKMLFISEHTAKDHTKNIYRKVGVHSRLELAALIYRWKSNQKIIKRRGDSMVVKGANTAKYRILEHEEEINTNLFARLPIWSCVRQCRFMEKHPRKSWRLHGRKKDVNILNNAANAENGSVP